MLRIGLNGFGRIGRNFVRAVMQDAQAKKTISIVAINIGPAKREFVAPMFKHDTLLGAYPGSVALQGSQLSIDNNTIELVAELDAKKIDWKKYSIDWVVDATGHYTHADKARDHIAAGAKKVLITAPAKGEDASIIPGVNMQTYDAQKHVIVSLGSCTTNAFMPMLKVIDEAWGIMQGYMTTVHAYTNSQVLLDVEAKDLRESRAAALNIIPTSTGASTMIGRVLPKLEGKIKASSLRVPVGKVSLIDLVVLLQKSVSVDQVNSAFTTAANGALKEIVAVTDEELVSSDFSGSGASVTIDSLLTQTNGALVQVNGWYDNEWGYSERLKDFLLYVAK